MADPLAEHRRLRDLAEAAGHDGEAQFHEAEADRIVFRAQHISQLAARYMRAEQSGDPDVAATLKAELDRAERTP